MSERLAALERRVLSRLVTRGDGGLLAPATLQRLLGWLYVSGATIAMSSLAFPQPEGASVVGQLGVYCAAYAGGAVLLAGRGRLPAWVGSAGLLGGSTLVTLAIHFTDARVGVFALFYLWVSITAFYFLGWVGAALQVVAIGALFGGVLAVDHPGSPQAQWILTVGTVTIAGLLIGMLRRGVERLIEDLEEAHRTDHARLYAAEREARVEADRATESLRRLQQVTDVALTHVELEDLLGELMARICEVLTGDTAVILLTDEVGDALVVRAARGFDPGVVDDVRVPVGAGFAGRVAAERRPIVLEQVWESDFVNPILARQGVASLMGLPLMVEGRVIGVLAVGSLAQRAFSSEEVKLAQLVAERIAVAIEHARLYEREHRIAETLQRSLLPRKLPTIPGLSVAARYLPARAEARVGGDWYDVVSLGGGGLAFSIGDVSGHGIDAASLMGELRNSLRVAALDGADATSAMGRAERVLLGEVQRQDRIATALFARLDGASQSLEYACAGHLPPLVVTPSGLAGFLEDARSVPLGVPTPNGRPVASFALERGSLLLMYTDGLVERRGRPITDGLDRLARAARTAGNDPELACDRVLEGMLGDEGPTDDVSILAVATGVDA